MPVLFMDDVKTYLLLSSQQSFFVSGNGDQTSLVSRNFKSWITDHSLKMRMDEIFCSFSQVTVISKMVIVD